MLLLLRLLMLVVATTIVIITIAYVNHLHPKVHSILWMTITITTLAFLLPSLKIVTVLSTRKRIS